MSEKKTEAFVQYLFERICQKKDKGFAAKLKKGDNEATEIQSWEILARWVDLEKVLEVKAFGLVGAAVARSSQQKDGSYGLGKALWLSLEDKKDAESSSAAARLRRLLSCQDRLELMRILRPTIGFLQSKEISMDYSRLLDEILLFDGDNSRERVRTRWAMEFFGQKEAE